MCSISPIVTTKDFTVKSAAETWKEFDELTIEQKEALHKAALDKLGRGRPSDDDKAFGDLWPILEVKIKEDKVAGALQKLMDEAGN
jgi:hypothetical protein